eukprot:1801146-Alexandrium_andersonii.AAC.1
MDSPKYSRELQASVASWVDFIETEVGHVDCLPYAQTVYDRPCQRGACRQLPHFSAATSLNA